MNRTIFVSAMSAAIAAATAVAASAAPSVFARSEAGLWELSGLSGTRAPARMCLTDLSQLAQVEHRGKACMQRVIRDTESKLSVSYECGSGDFGRSDIEFVTARNLRIVSQGISGGLPFAHKVQARRVGECAPKATPQPH